MNRLQSDEVSWSPVEAQNHGAQQVRNSQEPSLQAAGEAFWSVREDAGQLSRPPSKSGETRCSAHHPPVGSSRAGTPLRAAQPVGPPVWKPPLSGFPSRPAASFDIGNHARLHGEGQGNALTIWDRRALLIGFKDAASGTKWLRRLRLPKLFKARLGLETNKPLANRRLEALRMFAFERASGVRVNDSSAIAELHLDLQRQAKAFCDGYLSTQAPESSPASDSVRPGSVLPCQMQQNHSERREHASD